MSKLQARREFLTRGGLAVGALAAASPLALSCSGGEKKSSGTAGQRSATILSGLSATEGLLREHGVLDRILMLYETVIGQMAQGQAANVGIIAQATYVMRQYLEDHHAPFEHQYIYGLAAKNQKLPGIVNELIKQHKISRQLTDRIRKLATEAGSNAEQNKELITLCRAQVNMMRPHAAMEATLIFPALDRMGAEAEKLHNMVGQRDKEQFGGDALQIFGSRMDQLEAQVGINDIKQFTPQIPGIVAAETPAPTSRPRKSPKP
jgi:hemerythrin-like domain-containing protein